MKIYPRDNTLHDWHSGDIHPLIRLFNVLVISVVIAGCNNVGSNETLSTSDDPQEGDVNAELLKPLETGHKRSSLTSSWQVESIANVSAAIATSCTPLKKHTLYRFIDGHDDCPIEMTEAEIATELNDPWAVGVLRQGSFPDNVAKSVEAINAVDPTFQQSAFLVGEGSQIPNDVKNSKGEPIGRDAQRHLRYAITWNPTQKPIDIALSAAPGGHSGFLQVIAWDQIKKRFNFYDFGTDNAIGESTWSWAGDSEWARKASTIGNGCFDCHHNGVTIMKEFRVPWNNWNSALATVQSARVPEAVASNPLFTKRQNAPLLENAIRGAVQRYYDAWLGSLVKDGQLTSVSEILRHLIVNTTIQLDSSQTRSNGSQTSPPHAPINGLPNNFYLWDSVLRDVLQLDYSIPSDLKFEREQYDSYIETNHFALVNTNGDGSVDYEQTGSTNFAFFVPVPPQEDIYVIQRILNANLVTNHFVTAVLMVDFQNPVFSTKRESLQQYAQNISTGKLDGEDVPNQFAKLVLAAAAGQPACDAASLDSCSAEQQFLHYWELPDSQWKGEAEKRISAYMMGVDKQFKNKTAMDSYGALSVSRRHQFATTPIISNLCEMSLLLPRTSIPVSEKPLRMATDGSVIPGEAPAATAPAPCLMTNAK